MWPDGGGSSDVNRAEAKNRLELSLRAARLKPMLATDCVFDLWASH
jgi:hypothetical protein